MSVERSPQSGLPILQPLAVVALLALALLLAGRALGGVTASIAGTVKDPSGALIPGATVKATNTDTGISETQPTNAAGYYSFQSLALGHYEIEVKQTGFKLFRQTGLVLDVNSALVADVTLQVGAVTESVTVSSAALHVETANTQMGELITGNEMTGVPLVTRSYTDLLALQPGVVAQSSGLTGSLPGGLQGVPASGSAGFIVPLISGDLNAGNLSVNGMREAANGFLLNGATVQESGFGGTAVIPNLDSIAEFRILTNNTDAEYGNYAGGQINVITKSGTDQFHGDAFEFFRNTVLNARGFFDPARGAFHQNQFGGTIGGPIKRQKVFFFADYQGNRKVVGQSSQRVPVPSAAELNGDFSAPSLEKLMLGKTVSGPFWATQLTSALQPATGQTVTAGEAYFAPGCTTTTCVFPNAKIPTAAFSTPSKNILALNAFPPADIINGTSTFFSTAAEASRLTDNKTSGRVDGNTRLGMISGYYFFDNYSLTNPYPTATVPGFNALGKGRTQVANIGDTKTIGASTVNELRFEFQRLAVTLNQPSGGTGKKLSDLGFTTGANTLGINPLAPQFEGVPELDFGNSLSGLVVGVPSRPVQIFENVYQVIDNFSKVIGTHTLKFGGSLHYNQQTEKLFNVVNGNFVFNGSETGIDFADFLIGAPTTYVQGEAFPSYGRNHYFGLYGQDSWRVRSNLTLNYGLRWEFSTPWREKYNEIETLVPGLQSVVFPGSPTGWVFPGDPGIPSTLAPTRYKNFSPRIGLAYSPSAEGGALRKLLGEPGQSSIRAAWGLFYTTFEGATNFNEIGDAPYGFFYASTVPPLFTTPFRNLADGSPQGQRFPVQGRPSNVSAKNPDNSINWALFTPIASSPGFFFKNKLPYAEEYELSLQRQFSTRTLLTLSYIGSQAHRLLSTLESNPGSPALCNTLNQLGATPACGPTGENKTYVLPPGVPAPSGAFTVACPAGTNPSSICVPGTRAPFNPAFFGSNGYFATLGNSNYNSLQVNLRHTSGRAQLLLGYTYSKSLDDSSGYPEQVNPVNRRQGRGLSAFDATHNFVLSYNYRLPIDLLGGPKRLTNGWALSGITRFSTGLPVTLIEVDDNSELGTSFTGPFPSPMDTPSVVAGSLNISDPRSGKPYFNTALFSPSPVGQLGNADRRFLHGPGVNNWDMALLKDTKLTETTNLQFRAEFFNIFNHAQFQTPNGVLGSTSFGFVAGANPPRIAQLSLKLLF
ncbi:MAG: carboxypeptidase regulatory-like domain-containing protein [Candidatus Acidiferrales bacterium]